MVIGICSMALVACGGSGGGTVAAEPKPAVPTPVPVVQKPAELSLVAGTIQINNGSGAQARITAPNGVALDSLGNTYITQSGLHSVRKISPAGVVTVFAGDPANSGSVDGTGAAARFSSPVGIAVDAADNVYVVDTGNFTVRKITPAGLVSTLAGSPGVSGSVDGKGAAAQFRSIGSIAADPTGNIFVGDWTALRKIAADGSVTTLALPPDTIVGSVLLAADSGGNLFIKSTSNRHVLHKLTPAGVLTQVYEFPAGIGLGAYGMAVDAAGNVYLTNAYFTAGFRQVAFIVNTILKLSPQGVLTTIAGVQGETGFNDGQGLSARFNLPTGIAADRQGNLVVADRNNNTLRAISKDGVVSTLAGTADEISRLAADQRGNVVVADDYAVRRLSPGGSWTTLLTRQGYPRLALDSRGFLYVYNPGASEFSSSTLKQYTLDGVETGKTYATGSSPLAVDAQDNLYGLSGGKLINLGSGKTLADLGGEYGISAFVFDVAGNAYAVDYIRSIVLKVSTSGVASTLAGVDGKPGYKDGAGVAAQFNGPRGIAVVGTDVYVADTGNNLIRKIAPDGNVTTIAGTPGSLDTVMGTTGSIFRPTDMTTDSSNSLLVVADGKAIVRIRLQ